MAVRDMWRDSAFTLACSLAANVCLVASSLMIVRRFGGNPGESDRFFFLNSILVLGVLLANMGVPAAATVLLAAGEGRVSRGGGGRAAVASTFRLMVAAAAVSLAVLWVYAEFVSGRTSFRQDFPALALCMLLFAPCKWISGVLQGLGRLRSAAAFESSLEVLRFAILAAVLLADGGPGHIVRGWAWAGGLHLLLGLFLLRGAVGTLPRDSDPAPPVSYRARHAVLAVSLFLPFAGLFGLTHGLTLLLAERGAVGDAGRWMVGLQIASVLPLLAGPLGTVLLPFFARKASAAGPGPSLVAAAGPILIRSGLLLLGATAALMAGAGPLLQLLFAPASSPGVGAVRVLGLLFLLESLKFALDPLFVAAGLWKPLAGLEAARLVLALALGSWLVARWSLDGALTALAAAMVLSAAGKAFLFREAAARGGGRVHALG